MVLVKHFPSLVILLSIGWLSEQSEITNTAISDEIEYFKPSEAAEELGLSVTSLVVTHTLKGSTVSKWRINQKFVNDEVREVFQVICSEKKLNMILENCEFTEIGITADYTPETGVPEPKNKTVSFMKVNVEPFKKTASDGSKQICMFVEIKIPEFFITLLTFSEQPSNDTLPKSPIDSVAMVHQHQLGKVDQFFWDMFEDAGVVSEEDYVFDFGEKEYSESSHSDEELFNSELSEDDELDEMLEREEFAATIEKHDEL